MDPQTIRAIAKLVRDRADHQARRDAGPTAEQRLGAKRAMVQLARDLEVMAEQCERGDGQS
jgi:hypothetical protein